MKKLFPLIILLTISLFCRAHEVGNYETSDMLASMKPGDRVFRFDWSGKWSDFLDVTDTIRREGELAAASGELESRNAIAVSIKAQTEAYILDKAAELGASVQAEVSVNADLWPDGAVLTGNVSPYVKSRLSALLETQLGIAKEALVWKN